MRLLILTYCIMSIFQSTLIFAQDTKELAPSEISDLLSGSGHPGEGSLVLSGETEKETINFGIDSGAYGVGLVLKGAWLPQPYKNELSKTTLIQIMMGTVKSKLEGKVAQFGTVTLVSPELPKETTAFLVPETGKPATSQKLEVRAMLMSPRTQLNQSDQDKLQSTVFGHSGGVTVTPIGEAKQIVVRDKESKFFFKSQKMKLDFNMVMSTPFSGLEKQLTGSISFPVYVPYGKAAETLAMRLGNKIENGHLKPKQKSGPERKVTGSSLKPSAQ